LLHAVNLLSAESRSSISSMTSALSISGVN
jgi:hypothetical protein